MALHVDKDRIRSLLTETMVLLCRNSLQFKTMFSIEALIGITIDQSEVLLLRVDEHIGAADVKMSVDSKYSGFGGADGAKLQGGKNACGLTSMPKHEDKSYRSSHLINFRPDRRHPVKTRSRGGKVKPNRSSNDCSNFSDTEFELNESEKTSFMDELDSTAGTSDPRPIFLHSNARAAATMSKLRGSYSFAGKRGFHNNSKRLRSFDRPQKSALSLDNSLDAGDCVEVDIDVDLDTGEEKSTLSIKKEMHEEDEQTTFEPEVSQNDCSKEDRKKADVLPCSSFNENLVMGQPATQASLSLVEFPSSRQVDDTTGVILTPGNPRMYSCSYCGKLSSSKRELLGHMATRHNLAKEYACKVCGTQFSYKRGLFQHYRKFHNMNVRSERGGRNSANWESIVNMQLQGRGGGSGSTRNGGM